MGHRLRLLLVVVVLLAAALPAWSAPCRDGEREVGRGTVLLAGPGLGFDVVSIAEETACRPVLRQTEDGAFALVQVGPAKVAWLATGSVDARLSGSVPGPAATDAPTEEASGDGEGPDFPDIVLTVRPTSLRASPAFDAKARGPLLTEGTRLVVLRASVDEQWYEVEPAADHEETTADTAAEPKTEPVAEKKKSKKRKRRASKKPVEDPTRGWIPRYLVAEVAVTAGAAPDAGAGRWAGVRQGRTPFATSTVGLAEAAATTAAVADAAATDPDASAVEEENPFIAGRTQEVRLSAGYSYFRESFVSDARDDQFARYELDAPTGGEVRLGYGFRGAFPLVVDLDLTAGLTAYNAPFIDILQDEGLGNLALAPEAAVHVGLRLMPEASVGWRLYETAFVDVEAGVRVGADLLLHLPLDAQQASPVVMSAFGLFAGPKVSARSRLGDGRFGVLVVEGSIPMGGYRPIEDPYERFLDGCARAKGAGNLAPDVVDPVYGAPNADVDPVLSGDARCPEGPAAPFFVSPLLGADGVVRYIYPITPLFQLHAYGAASLRQAFLGGPGYRTGAYSLASLVDVFVSTGVGLTLGF